MGCKKAKIVRTNQFLEPPETSTEASFPEDGCCACRKFDNYIFSSFILHGVVIYCHYKVRLERVVSSTISPNYFSTPHESRFHAL